jgi:hypothetical protein
MLFPHAFLLPLDTCSALREVGHHARPGHRKKAKPLQRTTIASRIEHGESIPEPAKRRPSMPRSA